MKQHFPTFIRAAQAVKSFWFGRLYEGAQKLSDKRGYIGWPEPQDARFDVNAVDRTELVRKSRGFYANNAIVNRLADLFEQFTVGPNGLQMIPDSDDEKWNEAAALRFEGWCQFPDLTSRLHFSTLQSICACVWFVDGEVFILKTFGDEVQQGGRVVRRPRVQLIESHRVKSPDYAVAGATIYDGIEVDKRGRPIAYWVYEENEQVAFGFAGAETYRAREFRRIPAEQIIHIFEPSRPGQYRGTPFISPVVNDIQDLDELQDFAKGKAKENSTITRVLMNSAGEFDNSPTALMRRRETVGNQKANGQETTEDRTKFLQRIFGNRALAIKTGEELKEYLNNTPTVADRELWSILTSRICIGVGIPKILVFPESIQGTVARGDFDVANAFFRARSQVLAVAFAEIYSFVMDWEIKNTLEVSDPPADWRKVFVCPPRAVNVDVGYNAAATQADLECGLTTYRAVYAARGCHWRTELRQIAKEAAYIDALATEFKITASRIRASAGESLKQSVQQENETRAKQDEEVVTK